MPPFLRMRPCHHRPLRLLGHDGHPSQTYLERIYRRRCQHGQPHASRHVRFIPLPVGHGQGRRSQGSLYDVVGSLCENCDKFAVDRSLPEIKDGDILVIHDAGAHGHSMGFNYNGKLRSAELLLHADGTVTQIRRAETLDDLFATLDFSNL